MQNEFVGMSVQQCHDFGQGMVLKSEKTGTIVVLKSGVLKFNLLVIKLNIVRLRSIDMNPVRWICLVISDAGLSSR